MDIKKQIEKNEFTLIQYFVPLFILEFLLKDVSFEFSTVLHAYILSKPQ